MMAAPAIDFASVMEAVARRLWGDPNARLCNTRELRWGTHGSRSVDLEKHVWHDHEAATGGGVLDLVRRELRLNNGEAVEWLRREGFAPANVTSIPTAQRIEATYDYVDEVGEVVFQVVRYGPQKDFRQRRPDGAGGWAWGVKGVRLVPYNLPAVQKAIRKGETVFVVEGEKDVQALAREGLTATCNAMGAGKWNDDYSIHFVDADVVVIPDNDDAGRAHAQAVCAGVKPLARSVRVLELPDLPPKGDASDWLNAGGDREALIALAGTAKVWAPGRPQSAFGAIGWGDLERVKLEYAPLVKGLMFQSDTGMFYGESGSGKSFLAVDMGVSIARGVPFLGMKTSQGPVLYQAGEGGKGLVRRLQAYKREHQVTADVPFELLPEKVNLFAADGDAEAFIAECRAWKAYYGRLSLIVIDTFSAASAGANENASEDMGRMLDAGYRLNKETGAAILWVHHKNAAGLRERGHTSFRANIETVVEVKKDPETNERELHLVKLKDGVDGLRLGFELQSVELGSDDDGDPITSCVVRPAQLGSAQTGKKAWLPRGQYDFLRTLETAIHQRGGAAPEVERPSVDWEDFKDLFTVICGFGREPGAIRTALSRDGKELLLAGLIGRHGRWLWLTEKGEKYL